jgi:hypothetical protein
VNLEPGLPEDQFRQSNQQTNEAPYERRPKNPPREVPPTGTLNDRNGCQIPKPADRATSSTAKKTFIKSQVRDKKRHARARESPKHRPSEELAELRDRRRRVGKEKQW